VVYNIPPNIIGIDKATNPPGVQAKNGVDQNKYIGPCPPNGEHRYFFKLYALDITLPKTINSRNDLLHAIKGHVIDEAELLGRFRK
jgi:Raf kinase inhibitor-like YbhB/YbcL family protein